MFNPLKTSLKTYRAISLINEINRDSNQGVRYPGKATSILNGCHLPDLEHSIEDIIQDHLIIENTSTARRHLDFLVKFCQSDSIEVCDWKKVVEECSTENPFGDPHLFPVVGCLAQEMNFDTDKKLCVFLETIKHATDKYWQREGNISGGNLHIFLEDGNSRDNSFHFLLNHCLENDDHEAVVLATLWKSVPAHLRDPLLRLLKHFPSAHYPNIEWLNVDDDVGMSQFNVTEYPWYPDEAKRLTVNILNEIEHKVNPHRKL